MWGNILTETIVQTNFHIGFSNNKSDVLIHLAQWQYWWWFWFTWLWSFYYLTILRVVRFRTLKFKPKIATTQRPHGKWGDLLICIIPVSWCSNILSNSTFILRMIEWQAEAGLFTVRIRGKQWYWIYKFELKSFTDILTVPKNVGRNKWSIYTPGDLQTANDYLHVLQLRSQNKWVKKYWNKYLVDTGKSQNFHLISPQEQLRYNFKKNLEQIKLDSVMNTNTLHLNSWGLDLDTNNFVSEKNTYLKESGNVNYFVRAKNKKANWEDFKQDNIMDLNILKNIKNDVESLSSSDLLDLNRFKDVNTIENVNKFFKDSFMKNQKNDELFYKFNDFSNISRWLKRSQGTSNPVRIIKLPVDDEVNDIIRIRFYEPETTIHQKPTPHTTFLTMKQKRYARKKAIFPRNIYVKDEFGKKQNKIKYSGKLALYNNEVFQENYADATKQYRFFRKNKKRSENTSILLSKRMLRTRRTLVLPAHVNITAITNSYDVIHSWFIPGLGLKMDCIPGRATHHTFYIDNVGFYYGQCAEICGRYHHHMPIRICALPFEHFLVWWHSFGLPKLISTRSKKRFETYYANRKYVW